MIFGEIEAKEEICTTHHKYTTRESRYSPTKMGFEQNPRVPK